MPITLGSVKLTKWQLALLIGTPVAIGVGAYLIQKSKSPKGSVDDGGSIDSKSIKSSKSNKSIKSRDEKLGEGDKCEAQVEKGKLSESDGDSEKLTPLKEANNYKIEGNNCYRLGKFDLAIEFYDKAIATCPREHSLDMSIFYQNRAAAYERLKKWSKVKEDCTKSLEYNPRYAKAYIRRAKAHEATGDLMKCLDDVTATCILEMFQNNSTIIYADTILKETGSRDATEGMLNRKPMLPSRNFIKTYLMSFVSDPIQSKLNLDKKIVNGDTGIENGDVETDGHEAAPLRGYLKAKKALDEERYDDIIAACTEEIESSEAESQYKTEALMLRGLFHLLSGAFKDTKRDLDAVINNADVDPVLRGYALIRRASLAIQLNEREECLKDFELAEEFLPNNADLFHQRAQVYILIERLHEALREFEIACKLAPNHGIAHAQKCYAEYRTALISENNLNLARTVSEFKRTIDKFPGCVECYSLLAQVLSDQEQYAQAERFYDDAIRIAPQNATLYVHKGIMMLQWKGDVQTAVSLMDYAISVDDKCELAYETLGTIEVQRANLERAVGLFEKAICLARSQSEMSHLYALRNAALAQINVTKNLGIDMAAIASLAQQGSMGAPPSGATA